MTTKDLMVLKKETADIVLSKVQHFQKNGELDLPPNYSAANALKSAWLILQDTKDKDKNLVLNVCNKASIANTLLDMVVQGLNPQKKQCYFIAFGRNLTLMRSYFGTKAVAMRVNKDISDIYAEVVYQGDNLEYRIDKGRRIVETHTQKLEHIDDSKILAAYAVAIGQDGEVMRSELMTMDQLKQAWKQSKMNPIADNGNIKAGSTHGKFTAEMAKKTVTSRLSKHFINSSDDSDLVIQSVKRTDDKAVEAEAEAEIEEYANAEVIDIDTGGSEVDAEFDGGLTEDDKLQIETEEKEAAVGGPGF